MTVPAKRKAFAEAVDRFIGAATTFQPLEGNRLKAGTPPDGWTEAKAAVDRTRNEAIRAIGAVEQAMREDLYP
jgi:hypothetical protein